MSYYKQYALQYAKLGMAVIPLHPREKYPIIKEWQWKATNDQSQIRDWWSESPNSNIGFVTGKRSDRIVVLDLDEHPKEGKFGIEILRDWEAKHGKFPVTWEAVTGSGGRHLYFRDTEDRPRAQHLYNGSVDFQSDSALIVLPPSVHPCGNVYYWDVSPDDVPLADIDENVLAFIHEGMNQTPHNDPFDNPPPGALIEKGCRVSTLVSRIGKLTNSGLAEESIRSAIYSENKYYCNPPLTDQELEKEVFPAIRRYLKPASQSSSFQLPDILTGRDRIDQLYRATYSMMRKNFSESAILLAIAQENREKCNPPLTLDELQNKVIDLAFSNFKKGVSPNGRTDNHIGLDEISPFFRSK